MYGQEGMTGGQNIIDAEIVHNSVLGIDSKYTGKRKHTVKHICNLEQCRYIGENATSVQMHKTRCHKRKCLSKMRKTNKQKKELQDNATVRYGMEFATCANSSNISEGTLARSNKNKTKRIARKDRASFVESRSQCHSSEKVPFLSSINDTGIQHEGMTILAPKPRQQQKVPTFVQFNAEANNASVHTQVSTNSSLRRSVRISNRKRP